MRTGGRIGAVIIGRNEGERLVRCLRSIIGHVDSLVYVDSGSTDGSIETARAIGAEVILLDRSYPFTAARARNAGLEALLTGTAVDYVQFVDGDCELQPGWINVACEFLDKAPRAAVACGRRRERLPDASVYNRLCDFEWNTPIGQAKSCGGDALMRVEALRQVGGFNPVLIAGEEPELCIRFRAAGWQIWRLDHEMTLHDAAITRFGQWWRRARRGGHAYAEGMMTHGRAPEWHGVIGTIRAMGWGIGLPAFTLALAPGNAWAFLLLLAYPAQVVRLALREDAARRDSWEKAFFMTLVKFAEAQGVLGYFVGRLIARPVSLIEYK